MGARRPKTELYCHFVWGTWDREHLIAPEHERQLYAVLWAKLDELKCSEITIGGVADHVHVVCRFPPTIAIADLAGQIKGVSSHAMTHAIRVPSFRWQGGYGAFTFATRNLPRIVDYVNRQKEHHSAGTLVPYLEETEEASD